MTSKDEKVTAEELLPFYDMQCTSILSYSFPFFFSPFPLQEGTHYAIKELTDFMLLLIRGSLGT